MLDILVLSGLGLAVVLGYRRGLLSAAAGLVFLSVGIVVGYRVGPVGQGVVESWTGASPLTSRFIASAVVFLVVFLVGRLLIRRILVLSGPVRLVDQFGGALVAAAAFVVVAGLLILAVASAPYLPSAVVQALDQSRAVALVTSEGPRFTPGISRLLGDRVLESYLNLRRLSEESPVLLDGVGDGGADVSAVGDAVEDIAVPVIQLLDRLVVIEGDERVEITPAEEPVQARPDLATELLDRLNLFRVEAGEEPLAWSAALAEIAAGHGVEMYEEGYFSHVSPGTGSVADRLVAQGIPFRIAGENLALNPTVDGVHGGLAASPSHRATMLETRFTRVGISVHDGPLGLMVVQVFTG
ncbi:MAG: CvpA family protein [bacterium]|nr:CvpA family protein [bacterium]